MSWDGGSHYDVIYWGCEKTGFSRFSFWDCVLHVTYQKKRLRAPCQCWMDAILHWSSIVISQLNRWSTDVVLVYNFFIIEDIMVQNCGNLRHRLQTRVFQWIWQIRIGIALFSFILTLTCGQWDECYKKFDNPIPSGFWILAQAIYVCESIGRNYNYLGLQFCFIVLEATFCWCDFVWTYGRTL
jgi:hypothetical protein